jgi:hypothetical protein
MDCRCRVGRDGGCRVERSDTVIVIGLRMVGVGLRVVGVGPVLSRGSSCYRWLRGSCEDLVNWLESARYIYGLRKCCDGEKKRKEESRNMHAKCWGDPLEMID